MNCAWCGKNSDGSSSHGICDACMALYFGVNPARVHAEITAEETQIAATCGNKQALPIWEQLYCRRTIHSSGTMHHV